MKTPLWNQFENQLSLQFERARELVERNQEHVVDRNANLTIEKRVSTGLDILMASVDTTAETAIWVCMKNQNILKFKINCMAK